MLRSIVVAVVLIAVAATALAGEPPTVKLQAPGGLMTVHAGSGFVFHGSIDDPDSDLAAVVATLQDEHGIVFQGACEPQLFGAYWAPIEGTVGLEEKLYALTVTAYDWEGNSDVAQAALQGYLPPTIVTAEIIPPAPSASEPVVISVDAIDDSPLTVTAHLLIFGSLPSLLDVDLTWNAATGRYEAHLDSLPAAGDLDAKIRVEDPFTGTSVWIQDVISPAITRIDQVDPDGGLVQEGVPVTVTGDGFKQDVDGGTFSIRFGDDEAEVVSVPDDETVVVIPPPAPAPGVVDVTVSLSKGGIHQESTLVDGYTYLAGPTIATHDPTGASATLGFELRVTGSGFLAGSPVEVALGEHAATQVEVVADDELRAIFDPIVDAPPAPVDLTVRVGVDEAIRHDAFAFAGVGLLPVGELALPAGTPARSAAFVGWLESPGLPGSIAIGRPDAPAGERIVVHPVSGPAAPKAMDEWIYSSEDLVLGDLVGLEGTFWDFPGIYNPELLVGSLAQDHFDGTVGGAVFAFGSDLSGYDFGEEGDELGFAFTALRDEDRDGVPDAVIAGAPGRGRLWLVDGSGGYVSSHVVFTSGEPGDRLGESLGSKVRPGGATIAVGAPLADHGGIVDGGSVLVFEWSPFTLLLLGRIDATEAGLFDGPFGRSMPVAVVGAEGAPSAACAVVVGQPGHGSGRGGVEAYSVDGIPRWSLAGVDVGDGFGHAVVAVPDLDGDHHDDLLIGAPGEELAGELDAGAVHVVSGATGVEIFRIDGAAAGERFGAAVFATSDADGNLMPELLVATDAQSGGNALRRYSLDPRCLTVTAGVGASFEGSLSDPNDRDGLSLQLVAGEKIELRVFGEHAWWNPLDAALVSEGGQPLLQTTAEHWQIENPQVKRFDDHWRLRYEAAVDETVSILVQAPQTNQPRPYLIETERLAGAVETWTEKIELPLDEDQPFQVPFTGREGFQVQATVIATGAKVEDITIVDEDDHLLYFQWKKKKGGAVLWSWAILDDAPYTILLDHSKVKKKSKVKVKVKFVLKKWTSSQALTEWNQGGGFD